jgi:hypothetical protein
MADAFLRADLRQAIALWREVRRGGSCDGVLRRAVRPNTDHPCQLSDPPIPQSPFRIYLAQLFVPGERAARACGPVACSACLRLSAGCLEDINSHRTVGHRDAKSDATGGYDSPRGFEPRALVYGEHDCGMNPSAPLPFSEFSSAIKSRSKTFSGARLTRGVGGRPTSSNLRHIC